MEEIHYLPLDSRRYGKYVYTNADLEEKIVGFLNKTKVTKDNCSEIFFGQNYSLESILHSVDLAIRLATEEKQEERVEILQSIKQKAERIKASAAIFAMRYNKENGKIESNPDSLFTEWMESRLSENQEKQNNNQDVSLKSNESNTMKNYVYIYLTNAKDMDEFLKRLVNMQGFLGQYKDLLKNAYEIEIQPILEQARIDFESGDILGIKKEEDEGER